jgi:glucosamine kinase
VVATRAISDGSQHCTGMFHAPSASFTYVRTSAMAYYLGIDGGGTKTRCVLADETAVLAQVMTGGCSVIRLGEKQARESLHGAIRQVCTTAKIPPERIAAVCIGATGVARPEIAETIRKIVGEMILATAGANSAPKIEVVADTVIALEAAFGAGPGVIVIAGTGSIAYGRDLAGHTARAGGWGFAISDEGSGYWIGRRAISAILRAYDQGDSTKQDQDRETSLTALVLRAWKLRSIDELVAPANATPPPEFARLFPIVLRAADEGDPIAREILDDAGSKLAGLAATVVRRLAMHASPNSAAGKRPLDETAAEKLSVAMTGSVFRQSASVREVLHRELREIFPGIEVHQNLADPVDGALARARRM